MFPTADQSAIFKQALKHKAASPLLRRMAERHPLEWDEACAEVEQGFDTCTPDSLVATEVIACTCDASAPDHWGNVDRIPNPDCPVHEA